MIRTDEFFGRSQVLSISADTIISHRTARVWVISATSAGLKVKLPKVRTLPTGAPCLEIINNGSNTFTVTTNNGTTTVATVAAGQWATIVLLDTSGTQGVWFAQLFTAGSATANAPTYYGYFMCGDNGPTYTSVHEWNQVGQSWTLKTAAPVPHASGCSFMVAGAGYVVGGLNLAGGGVGSRVDKYDPDTWTNVASTPTLGISDDLWTSLGVTLTDGKGYTFGGKYNDTTARARTLQYDLTSWATKTARTLSRTYSYNSFQANIPGGGIGSTAYVLAGGQPTHNYCDKYEVDTYTALTERPGPGGGGQASAVLQGDVWSFAGYFGGTNILERVTSYDPATDVHTVQSPSFPGIGNIGMLCVSINDVAYVGLGIDDANPFGTTALFKFDPVSASYTSMPACPDEHYMANNQAQAINV